MRQGEPKGHWQYQKVEAFLTVEMNNLKKRVYMSIGLIAHVLKKHSYAPRHITDTLHKFVHIMNNYIDNVNI